MERIRMKALTTFHNPLITSHAEGRRDDGTVIDGDEFSTDDSHAGELENLGYAERVEGEAAPESDRAKAVGGSQRSARDGIQSDRVETAKPGGTERVVKVDMAAATSDDAAKAAGAADKADAATDKKVA